MTEIPTNGRAEKGRKYFSGRRKDVACDTDGEDSCFYEDAIINIYVAAGALQRDVLERIDERSALFREI